MGGSDFSTERPLESFKSLQLAPWPGYIENLIDDDRIPVRGLIGGEGQVGEKVQELTAVTGVAGVGEEKGRGGKSTASRGGRRGSEGQRWRSHGRRVGERRGSS
jgi:hypothetical protein